jgi:hypothetical protein
MCLKQEKEWEMVKTVTYLLQEIFAFVTSPSSGSQLLASPS